MTDVAVAMLGQAFAAPPVVGLTGKLVVVTVQLLGVWLIVQSEGKTITTFVSVPTVSVSRHAVPVIADPVACLSNLKNAVSTVAPALRGDKKGYIKEIKSAT